MKGKHIAAITGFYGFILITSLVSSFGLLRYDASVSDILFTGVQYSWEAPQPDDLTQVLGFRVIGMDQYQTANHDPGFSLLSSCYATTKCAEWQNALVESSYTLSFDKQVIIKNDTIDPGQDLLSMSSLRPWITISTTKDCDAVLSTITFSDDLKNGLVADTGIYQATFRCRTSDGKVFEKHRNVILTK